MFREANVEEAIIEQLQELGYEYQYGPDIERDYKETILKDVFYASLHRINKGITKDIADEVYRKIRNFRSNRSKLWVLSYVICRSRSSNRRK